MFLIYYFFAMKEWSNQYFSNQRFLDQISSFIFFYSPSKLVNLFFNHKTEDSIIQVSNEKCWSVSLQRCEAIHHDWQIFHCTVEAFFQRSFYTSKHLASVLVASRFALVISLVTLEQPEDGSLLQCKHNAVVTRAEGRAVQRRETIRHN